VVAVQDSTGRTFGVFVNEPLYPHVGYYGNGECFLWREREDGVEAFKWTGKNNYFILCENENLAFGGGQGRFGLWIDSEFEHGSSAHCETFDNPPLPSNAPLEREIEFECDHLEVWGFQF